MDIKRNIRNIFIKSVCLSKSNVNKIALLTNHDCDNTLSNEELNDIICSLNPKFIENYSCHFLLLRILCNNLNILTPEAQYQLVKLIYTYEGAAWSDICSNINSLNLSLRCNEYIVKESMNNALLVSLNYLLDNEKFDKYHIDIIKYLAEHYGTDYVVSCISIVNNRLDDECIKTFLDLLNQEKDKKTLCRILKSNVLDSKYYNDIMHILNECDDLCMDDIKNIPLEKFNELQIAILISIICKIGTSEEIYEYFTNNKEISSHDYELIVNTICESKDKITMLQMMQNDRLTNFYDDIFAKLALMDKLSFGDICYINFALLTKSNQEKYLDIYIKKANTETLYEFVCLYEEELDEEQLNLITERIIELSDMNVLLMYASVIDKLDSYDIELLKDKVVQSGSALQIYSFATDVDNLSEADISDLANAISKTDNIEYIYLFLKDVKNIDRKNKEILKSKILRSYNMKFICLLAIYIDVKLIETLFKNMHQMFSYIVSCKLFNEKEILEIQSKLFNTDVNSIELDAQAELSNLNRKMYALKENN